MDLRQNPLNRLILFKEADFKVGLEITEAAVKECLESEEIRENPVFKKVYLEICMSDYSKFFEKIEEDNTDFPYAFKGCLDMALEKEEALTILSTYLDMIFIHDREIHKKDEASKISLFMSIKKFLNIVFSEDEVPADYYSEKNQDQPEYVKIINGAIEVVNAVLDCKSKE